MLGQASRFLFKLIERVEKGYKLEFPYSYLNNISQVMQLQDEVKTIEDLRSLKILELALQVRAAILITQIMGDYRASKDLQHVKDNETF